MKKNIWFLGLPVCVLVLGILCASCNTSTSPGPEPKPEPDTWSPVTSLDQLDGTWKGSYKETMPIKDAIDDDTMALLLEYMKGSAGLSDNVTSANIMALLADIKAAVSADITITINASKKTRSGFVKMTITLSGENVGIVWLFIKPAVSQYDPDAVFDDKNHSVTITQDIPEESITDEEIEEMLASGVQINQNGKKIKIPTSTILEGSLEGDGDIPPGLTGLIPEEIIMTKQ